MAILYDPTTDTMANVGATSKALATTLYDSTGLPIVRDSAYVKSPNVYSFYTSSAPLATSGLSAVWLNLGPRRCRLRSIGVHGSQVNAASAAQATVTVARAYLGGPFISTSAGAFLTPQDFRAAVKRSSLSKSPSAFIVDNSTGLILTTAIGDQATMYTYAIPQRTVSHAEQFFAFDTEGEDSDFYFDIGECITFTLNAGFSNAANVSVDWDEYAVP